MAVFPFHFLEGSALSRQSACLSLSPSLVTRAAGPLNTHSCPHYLSSSINTQLGELSPASPHFSSPVMLPSSGTVLFMGQVMEP